MTHLKIDLQPKVVISLIMSTVFLLLAIVFWYWIFKQGCFAVGQVREILSAGNTVSVVILNNLFNESAVAMTQSDMATIKLYDWVLVYGEFDTNSELLHLGSIHSNEVITTLFSMSPAKWLTYLTSHSYLSMIIAGLLILSSGRSLQFGFSLLMTVFLIITTWHASLAANELGYLDAKEGEMYFLILLVAVFSFYVYRLDDEQKLSSRLMAILLIYAYGEQVLTWFSFSSEPAMLILFVIGLCFPILVSSLFAGYLLSNALGSSFLGSYMLLIFSYILSLGLLSRNTSDQYKAYFNKVFHQEPKIDIKGKITLAQLLNKQRIAS